MNEFDAYDIDVDLFEMECADCEKVYVVGQLTINGKYVAQVTFTEFAEQFDSDEIEQALDYLVDEYFYTYVG